MERGRAENETKYFELDFTSVLFELEIEDPGLEYRLRVGNQPRYSASFYSFPNNQFHIIGERNYCRISNLSNPENCKINIYMKEAGIHSASMTYVLKNFESLSDDLKSLRGLNF